MNRTLPAAAAAVLALTSTVWLAGCATTPMPTTELIVADAAVKNASTSTNSANAPAELQLAVSKLALARQAEADKDYERAKWLAEEAQVDAQAADMHAQSTQSRKAAKDSQDAARVLSEELRRNAKPGN
ncbi:DUF4398 domain-containing protein [Paucibacter sp. R3-3]|uniref:DUF4398 domain-containing protein n=1 Tax=Roseateles agri TaxID=3098619 RepID=A0ABU5DR68_9BURK|nr:DUF4398 domain-containing protein [Paucibacter sp. R3-3]MDY0747537.1 DUF4398 domain-containing protein [Paucibacter sp. R3-3]